MLESGLYYASSPACQMTMWYNTFGSAGAVIQVLLKTKQAQTVQIFKQTTNNSTTWQRAQISVGGYQSFSFIIEIVFPRNKQGQIVAIDDISFSKCAPSKKYYYFHICCCCITNQCQITVIYCSWFSIVFPMQKE